MKGKLLLLFLFSATFTYSQNQDSTIAGNSEPRSTFKININGKTYTISENEELKLDTLILKPTISVKLADHKIFDNSSFSFEYPRHLSYEFEQDFAYKNWTFSGNSMNILVFELDAETTLKIIINDMVKRFGRKNCVIEDFQKQLGNKVWNGKKLFVSVVGQKIVFECYEIKLNDFKSRFIYFQDTLEGDKHSDEFKKVLALVDSTIIFN